MTTLAGTEGFIISFDFDADDAIRRCVDHLKDIRVGVTPNDADPFDAFIEEAPDGSIVLQPAGPEERDPDADPVPFDVETIDGLHVY